MSTSQTFFTKLAAHAKAHHESVNAAYETYYSGGISPRPSMEARQSSTSSSSSSSSLNKTWKSIKKHAKEHHEGMNAAYATYYGGVAASPASSVVSSPRASVEAPRMNEERRESGVRRAAREVKRMAKEHHRGVNAAYEAYYGAGMRS